MYCGPDIVGVYSGVELGGKAPEPDNLTTRAPDEGL
jgi:hypothetical protein